MASLAQVIAQQYKTIMEDVDSINIDQTKGAGNADVFEKIGAQEKQPLLLNDYIKDATNRQKLILGIGAALKNNKITWVALETIGKYLGLSQDEIDKNVPNAQNGDKDGSMRKAFASILVERVPSIANDSEKLSSLVEFIYGHQGQPRDWDMNIEVDTNLLDPKTNKRKTVVKKPISVNPDGAATKPGADGSIK